MGRRSLFVLILAPVFLIAGCAEGQKQTPLKRAEKKPDQVAVRVYPSDES